MFNFITNLKISSRIILLSAVPILGIGTLGSIYAASEYALDAAASAQAEFDDQKTEFDAFATEIRNTLIEMNEFVLKGDQAALDEYGEAVEGANKAIKSLSAKHLDPEVAALITTFQSELPAKLKNFDTLLAARMELGFGNKEGLLGKLNTSEAALLDAATEFNDPAILLRIQKLIISAEAFLAGSTIKKHMTEMADESAHDHGAEAKTDEGAKTEEAHNHDHSGDIEAVEARKLFDDTDTVVEAMLALTTASPAARTALDELLHQYRNDFVAWEKSNATLINSVQQQDIDQDALERGLRPIEKLLAQRRLEIAQSVEATHQWTGQVAIVAAGIVLALILLIGFLVSRSIIRPVRAITGVFEQVAAGHQNIAIPSQDQKDEIGQMARILASFHQNTAQATRTQSALNVASAPFMLSDNDGTIIALNKSAQDMFAAAEPDIVKAMPQFKAAAISGGNVSQFGANLSGGAAAARSERLVIGARTFDLVLTPVLSALEERLGTAIEWRDMTAQLATEQQIAGIVTAAGEGDFTRRLDLTDKQGFLRELGKGMNDLTETVDRGLAQTVRMMSALASGDLTQRVEGEFKGSFLQLKTDANSMADKIRAIARRISGVSREVQGATREISSGVADLSARTEHQASSLEETSASMEELATTVRQNSGNAQEANLLAAAASASAVNGGDIATKAVAAMGKIEDGSRQIGDIVGLIQDIAFQTNLLALNAAVEAARAGEAGKGFAVVANEVRALAQRAGQASKDIKGLIVNSDTQVREGVTLVKQAGASLTEIVASVKKVAGLVSEIAAATQEQSSGIEQVSKAVTGMDQMTQQNAALVEETNAALHSATSQVDELRKVVSFFQTGDAQDDEEPLQPATAANPVRQQFQQLARRVASGSSAAVAHDKWKEF